MPGAEPDLLVVAYGRPELLEAAVAPLVRRLPLTVVDNASDPATAALVARVGGRYIDPGRNLGFAAGVNVGLAAIGEHRDVLLLNPDATISLESALALKNAMRSGEKIACVAPGQTDPSTGRAQRVAWPLPTPAGAWIEAAGLGRLRRDRYVIGAVLLLSAEALCDVGPLDEGYFLYAEEADWERRAARRGWRIRFCPDLVATHVGAATSREPERRALLFHASAETFIRKFHGSVGWSSYRWATIVGAASRALLRAGGARREALERASVYFRGPWHLAQTRRAFPATWAASEVTGDKPAGNEDVASPSSLGVSASLFDARAGAPSPNPEGEERTTGNARDRQALVPRPVDARRRDERPLRVAHVVCTSSFAGVERHVTTLANELARLGCAVSVLGGEGLRMRAGLATSIRWRTGSTLSEARESLRSPPFYDIVHAHMTTAEVAALSSTFLRHRRIPVVATRHFAAPRGASLAGTLLAPLVARLLTAEVAVSDFVAQAIGVPSTVIRPGVPPVMTWRNATARHPVVLVVQRLEPEKDTATALRAFARAGIGADGWTLEVAGAGSEMPKLEALAGELGLAGSIRFLGEVRDPDSLYARASLFLATTPREGLGLAVIEAMAHGLPVVATGAGGHHETVGAVQGAALFPPGNAEAAGRLLAALARNPAERDAYGARLQTFQRANLTPSRQAEETLALYRRILPPPRARHRAGR